MRNSKTRVIMSSKIIIMFIIFYYEIPKLKVIIDFIIVKSIKLDVIEARKIIVKVKLLEGKIQ